jgi:hypothetical protein
VSPSPRDPGFIWTIEALKDYVDKRFAAAELAVEKAVKSTELAVDKAFAQNQRAIDKAEQSVDRRLEGMNEFRDQLTKERSAYITTDSFQQFHKSLEDNLRAVDDRINVRITSIERWQSKIVGALGFAVVFVPTLTALAIYLLNRR